MRVVSFVAASSGSGKTTLIEKVLRILKNRGLQVAVVKHASQGYELDRPGKDSWRFQEAGADAVVLVGSDRLAVMKTAPSAPLLTDLLRLAGDVDLVIIEGGKRTSPNRIEVFRSGVSGERPLCMEGLSCLAVASDVSLDAAVTRFDINDAQAIADFLLNSDSFLEVQNDANL